MGVEFNGSNLKASGSKEAAHVLQTFQHRLASLVLQKFSITIVVRITHAKEKGVAVEVQYVAVQSLVVYPELRIGIKVDRQFKYEL